MQQKFTITRNKRLELCLLEGFVNAVRPVRNLLVLICVVVFLLSCKNIPFSSLSAAGDVWRSSSQTVPSGEERGETDVFAGYVFTFLD